MYERKVCAFASRQTLLLTESQSTDYIGNATAAWHQKRALAKQNFGGRMVDMST